MPTCLLLFHPYDVQQNTIDRENLPREQLVVVSKIINRRRPPKQSSSPGQKRAPHQVTYHSVAVFPFFLSSERTSKAFRKQKAAIPPKGNSVCSPRAVSCKAPQTKKNCCCGSMNRATQDTNSNMGVDQLPFLPTRRGSHPIKGGDNIKCSSEDGEGLLDYVKRSRTTRSPHRSGEVLPHRSRLRSSSSSSRSTSSSSGSIDEPRCLRERKTLPAPPLAAPHNSRPAVIKRPPQRRSRSFNGLSRLRRSVSPALPTVTEFVKANFESSTRPRRKIWMP